MELFRALAVLAERPGAEQRRVAELLELGGVPSPPAYTEAFVMQLYPYASVYLGAEGKLGGDARDRIAGFWRALDAAMPAEPDHLATLLAAYAELAERSAGDPASPWWRARHALFWEHMASWLPAWADRARALAPAPYAAWAELLAAALEAEAERLGPPAVEPLHFRAVPPATLDGEDPDAVLDELLAPVRTGVIVTRRDLAAAADALGLGLRLGERRFILRQFLGQDPDRVRRWLAELAEEQAAAHRDGPAALRPAREPLAVRAAATASALRSAELIPWHRKEAVRA